MKRNINKKLNRISLIILSLTGLFLVLCWGRISSEIPTAKEEPEYSTTTENAKKCLALLKLESTTLFAAIVLGIVSNLNVIITLSAVLVVIGFYTFYYYRVNIKLIKNDR
ncbi:hypothetical protein EQM13_07750 [Acidilutibacter cellobiosedens]|uniref:Uncharacterized protein n=1 Tax=Acidilutibacter cellobiosedens TaxID=2507161 RepID=A0A410QBW7_9FIRM|nr:hypothetical protein [Acidilutibacter cellobiosedens]QAT61477.1 hypothetical protein EQM13_07750 [Acidilutibacter cellobiosedens]